ncbi:hypothetical protein NUW58_g9723 [Xylaria curta]|uniref:Uncharacterized protein n=1 Tax=Xylaria curta TaxID=42375 RepID=A0ACC1MVR8_9PEZI|nr:hypothetical protein NUW58_g9723 [Xylaria curta]
MLKAYTLDRGGLSVAHQALEDLLNDPKELDRGRCPLGQPPPVYRSYTPSGTTTQFPSPDRRTEEERWREKRSWQLREAYYASLPYNQLEVEVLEESKRISEGVEKKTYNAPVGKDFIAIAQENVEERWANRGIWNNKWERGSGVVWRWKHEEPPDVPTPKAELEQQSPTCRPLSPAIMETPNPYLSARECDEELQKNNEIHERERERERERDVSRPFHQFFYQVSEARERIQQQPGASKEDATYSADVNTTAYVEVKKAWINRGIWDRKWSIVPGMSWKHEGRTIEEFLEEEMKLPENAYPGDTIPHEGSDQEVDESIGMDMGEIYSRWNSVLASPAEGAGRIFLPF